MVRRCCPPSPPRSPRRSGWACSGSAICVWLGLTFDGGWIWVVSLIAGPAAAVAAAIALPPVRARADEQLLHELSGGRA